ncbi:MAG: amidohydrolase family protein [Verrucomicrobiota bacterium]
MKRRTLLTTALAGSAAVLTPSIIRAKNEAKNTIIDSNVDLFRWPFRRLPLDNTEKLVKKMRDLNIGQAWAGSFEGLLQRDISSVNRRLAETCARYEELIAFGSINPSLPDWENSLRVCREKHQMPGIRLHPNYHAYTLDDPRFARLLELADEAGLLVQIAVTMEDVRTQNPRLRVADVDLKPLPALIKKLPGLKVQLLNLRPRSVLPAGLVSRPNLSFDTARIDSTDGLAKLLRRLPADRLMFGTHAPFLIPEAALIRVAESRLSDVELKFLLRGNAEKVLKSIQP